MPYVNNFGDVVTQAALLALATKTADFDSTGVDISALKLEGEIIVSLDAINRAGSSPTMALKLQESDDDVTYTDVSGGAFTGLTTGSSTQKLSLNKDGLKKYLRVDGDIGGTSSPEYDLSILLFGVKKYPA